MNRFLTACFVSILLFSASFLQSSFIVEIGEKAITEAALDSIADIGMKASTEVSAEVSTAATDAITKSISSMADEATGILNKAIAAGMEDVALKALQDTLIKSIEDGVATLTKGLTTAGTDFAEALGKVGETLGTISSDVSTGFSESIEDLVSKNIITDTEADILKTGSQISELGLDGVDELTEKAGAQGTEDATKAAESTAKDAAEDTAKPKEKAEKEGGEKKKTMGQKVLSFFKESGKQLLGGLLMMIPQSFMSAIVAAETRNAQLANISAPIKIGPYVAQIPSQFINTNDPTSTIFLYTLLPLSSTTVNIGNLPDFYTTFPGLTGPGSDDITESFTVNTAQTIPRYQLGNDYLQDATWACTYPSASAASWATTNMNSSSASGKFVILNNGYVFVSDGTAGGNKPVQLVGQATSGMTVLQSVTQLLGKIKDSSFYYNYTEYTNVNATQSGHADSDVVERLFNCSCLEAGDYSNSCSGDDKTNCCMTTDDTPLAICMLNKTLETVSSGLSIGSDGKQATNAFIFEGQLLSGSDLNGVGQTGTSSDTFDTTATDIAGFFFNLAGTVANAAVQGIGGEDKKTEPKTSSTPTTSKNKATTLGRLGRNKKASQQNVQKTLAAIVQKAYKNVFKPKNIRATALTDDSGNLITALGSVIPAYGWGSSNLLTSFKVSVSDSSAAGESSVVNYAAPVDNYSVKAMQSGSNVYCCANTPFTRALRQAMGQAALFDDISDMSPTGPIVDYIIFLDKDDNQVPLMAVEKTLVYGSAQNLNDGYLPKFCLNPAIVSWVSLVSSDMVEFAVNESPVMYDLTGKPSGTWPLNPKYTTYQDQIKSYFVDVYNNVSDKLAAQMFAHKAAMEKQYLSGPFGKDALTTNDTLNFSVSNSAIVIYEGLNCPPIPIGDGMVSDYLIPFSASTATVVLPNFTDVSFYIGLVTDLWYTSVNGYLIPSKFDYAKFLTVDANGKYTIDSTKTSTYTLNNGIFLKTLGVVYDATTQKYTNTTDGGENSNSDKLNKLIPQIKANRALWLSSITALNNSGISPVDASGVILGSLNAKLFSTASAVIGCPIWLLQGGPLDYALYLATNDVSSDSTKISSIKPIQSSDFSDATVFVDVVSGLVVDQKGNLLRAASGMPIAIDVDLVVFNGTSGLKAKYSSAFNSAFDTVYNAYKTQYDFIAEEKLYPIVYGDKSLGIYRGDKDLDHFVYWTQNAGVIADYFVTYDASTFDFGGSLNTNPPYIVSLVDGQLYTTAGKSTKLSSQDLSSLISILASSGVLNAEVEADIKKLSTQAASALQNLANEAAARQAARKATMDAAGISAKQTNAERSAVALRLASKNYLPYPHDSLKQDDDGKYYHIGVADSTVAGTSVYLDFNVELVDATGADYKGKRCHVFYDSGNVGASYEEGVAQEDGSIQLSFDEDHHVDSFRAMYGVSVDSSGKQTLGAPSVKPILPLPVDATKNINDKALTPGASGAIMISASDSKFPTVGITSPVTYNGKEYYFYYNSWMQSYYAMVVDSAANDTYWISMADGSKYNLDGSGRVVKNYVAFGPTISVGSSVSAQALSSSTQNNILLPYEDDYGYAAFYLADQTKNNTYSQFVNDSSNFVSGTIGDLTLGVNQMTALSGTSVKIAQSPYSPTMLLSESTDFYVFWDESNSTDYAVNKEYSWSSLRLMDNVNDTYKELALATKSGAATHAIFGGNPYAYSSMSDASFILDPMFDSAASSIVVSLKTDANTGVAYVQVGIVGNQGVGESYYNYQYNFDVLSTGELYQYWLEIWQAQVVPGSTGKVLLAQNMPMNASGVIALTQVNNISEILDAPTDFASQSALKTAMVNIYYSGSYQTLTTNGVTVNGLNGSYYAKNSSGDLVRLVDGVQYHATTGMATGACETVDNLTTLVKSLQVAVNTAGNGMQLLSYRS